MNWQGVQSKVERMLNNQQGLTASFTFGASSYSGVRTNLKRSDVATDAGLYENNYVFSLLCPMSQFNGNYPKSTVDTITLDGETYRVLSTDIDAIQASIRLNLGSEFA